MNQDFTGLAASGAVIGSRFMRARPAFVVAAISASLAAHALAAAPRIRFPKDPWVIDAKRDLGARGDGVADDTAALQKGLDMSQGIGMADERGKQHTCVLFIPNGVYRVTRTLVVTTAVGPWVYGESRDGTIVRLDDGVKECRSVIRTHPRDEKGGSADWFMRSIQNLTVDAGNNPDTDGIRYCSTNTGILRDVRVIGRGKVGINAGFIDQSSPKLIQDAVVEGFETGIVAQWSWGETISRVTIRNCRKLGLLVCANAVGVEDLTVENTPMAVHCALPNDWGHWSGVLALVGGRFTGGDAETPAIRNEGVLYARDVKTRGFKMAIRSATPAGDVRTSNVTEYASHDTKMSFKAAPMALRLPIKPEPVVPWETDPAKWVCVNDFGAAWGDNRDDTEAFRKAVDAAAAAGKTTVYLRGVGGGDPNWYNLEGEVRIHGSVRHLVGLGFGRVIGGDNGRFIVDDGSAPVVKFQDFQAFGGRPPFVENRSRSRTLVVESSDLRVVGAGAGDVFVTNCSCHVRLEGRGQKLWARQLDPEGDSDDGLVVNSGGDMWCLGVKHEGKGVRFRTTGGGRTEVLGVFNYGSGMQDADRRPMFDVEDSSLSVLGLRELTFAGGAWPVKVRERRGGETRTLGRDAEPGWIGWALYSGWVIEDATPPGDVRGLAAAAAGPFAARLSWRAASDAESGVALYEISRDGEKVGTTRECEYVDEGLEESSTSEWKVVAVNGSLLKSRGVGARATTPADTTPPTVVSAYDGGDAGTVIVYMSKPVDDAARDAANWKVAPGVEVRAVDLDETGATATLTVDKLSVGRSYTVSVTGVKDRCRRPNPVARDARGAFTYYGAGEGLSATWFAGRGLEGRSFERVDPAIAYDLDARPPADGWPREEISARWTGRLLAPVAGTYELIVRSDDGARMWLDGQKVIDDWVDRGASDSVARVELAAGFHGVKIEYYQGKGGACVHFDWVPPGGRRATVPRGRLFPR